MIIQFNNPERDIKKWLSTNKNVTIIFLSLKSIKIATKVGAIAVWASALTYGAVALRVTRICPGLKSFPGPIPLSHDFLPVLLNKDKKCN